MEGGLENVLLWLGGWTALRCGGERGECDKELNDPHEDAHGKVYEVWLFILLKLVLVVGAS